MLAQNDTLQRWTDLNAYTCADAKDPSNVSIMQLETDVDDDVGCRFAAGVGDAPADNKTVTSFLFRIFKIHAKNMRNPRFLIV